MTNTLQKENPLPFQEAFADRTPATRALFDRAKRTVPGGAGSTARLPRNGWKPYPLFVAHGSGSRLTDVDGNTYIDYLLGLGPMILGHRHPAVTQAVADAIENLGTCFGLPYDLEVVAAEKVAAAVPGIEQVRFTNSGSEAVGTAVRLARATTGRRVVVRFEGHYHGWQDTVYWSNHVDPLLAGPANHPRPVAMGPGVPAELEGTLEVLTWNDPESFVSLMDSRGEEVAAVLTEPAVFNTGCILPEPGYLELLRSETRKHGVMLIFDEVITGFRFARGGAQEWFGVLPDLTTLAKGLGGGFPVAAVGGTTEAMRLVADGVYSHSGTYNANTVQCAAVAATMDVLAEPGLYERQRALGFRLAASLTELATERGLDAYVEGLGTVFQLWFADGPIRNWRDAVEHANEELFTRWYQEMVIRGVLFHPLQFENLFVSLVHDDRDIDETLTAAADALSVVARSRTAAHRS
jgi:glutamate-1-semialdehyde 2,1-aminomutase